MNKTTKNRKKIVWAAVGGLSDESKMPELCYGTPPRRCVTGAKLRKVTGSTCSVCYGCKGYCAMPDTVRALERRYKAWTTSPTWVEDMSECITLHVKKWFRWGANGDLPSVRELEKLCQVCEQTPHINHWLATREYRMVREYVESGGEIPDNLCIRLSAYMVDGPMPERIARELGVQMSGVSANGNHTCHAEDTGNKCGECRKCWDPAVKQVHYKAH